MGNNQAFTNFEATVIAVYNAGSLDKGLLSQLMEQYRGMDIDSGGMVGTISNDGMDVMEIVIRAFGKELPGEAKDSEKYWEKLWETFNEITDTFGWV